MPARASSLWFRTTSGKHFSRVHNYKQERSQCDAAIQRGEQSPKPGEWEQSLNGGAMSRRLRFAALIGCALIALAILAVLVRNYEFDSAARALKTGHYPVAVPRLKVLASLGDARAQYVLGSMYATGVGVEKDDDEAIRLFRKAAVGTHGEADPASAAELAVAKNYADGTEGVKPDQAERLKWLRRAAEGGSQEALAELQESQLPH